MRTRRTLWATGGLLLTSSAALHASPAIGVLPRGAQAESRGDDARAARDSARAFEPNLDRWPEAVLFHAARGGLHGWLDSTGWTFALTDARVDPTRPSSDPTRPSSDPTQTSSDASGAAPTKGAWSLRLNWPSAPQVVEPFDAQIRGASRFRGAGAQGRSDFVYGRVALRELAPGVDLVARADADALEYDLEVASGADPAALVLRWEGHCALGVDADGALVVASPLGDLRLPEPSAIEWTPSGPRALRCSYRVLDSERFCIEAARTCEGSRLSIDPALIWSSYLGGEFAQEITDLELLPSGAAVVCGWTASIDYPTTVGSYDPFFNGNVDAFVSMFAPDGSTLLWSTLLGGASDEIAAALEVDAAGRVFVLGETQSPDFPTTAGALDTTLGGARDVFALRLSADGSTLEWSTFLGGTSEERAGDMALRADGVAVCVGSTRGSGFPATLGAFDSSFNGGGFYGDGFVLALASDGASVVWATYLGGAGDDVAQRVALDASGQVTLSGMTYAASFPTTVGAFDRTFGGVDEPFVARLSSNGASLLFSTFLGGAETESIRALALRPDGSVLVGGETEDPNFAILGTATDGDFGPPTEGYLVQLAANGSSLLRSTFFGGSDADAVTSIHTDATGRIIVGGETLSADLPTTPGAYDDSLETTASGSAYDVFLARMTSDLLEVEYLTYFGGRNADRLTVARSDPQGKLVFAGTTHGASFPTTPNALQPDWNVLALQEGFVSKLDLLLQPIRFGAGKLNSSGGTAAIRWQGFPSVGDADFSVGIDLALANVWCTAFSSTASTSLPYRGGRLYVAPPFTRYTRFKSDFIGYGLRAVPLEPWMAGQTLYFQIWYQDDQDPFGCGLTDALRVLVYP